MDPVDATAGKEPGRRWYQFGIKTLLLVTLLVASFFSGRATQQRDLDRLRALAERAQAIAEQSRAEAERARFVAEQQRVEAARARAAIEEACARIAKACAEAEPSPATLLELVSGEMERLRQAGLLKDSAGGRLRAPASFLPLNTERAMKIDAIERALRFDYQRRCRQQHLPAVPCAAPVLVRPLGDLHVLPAEGET